jgi:hypothetical protein
MQINGPYEEGPKGHLRRIIEKMYKEMSSRNGINAFYHPSFLGR